jgi:hypothetical protein
MFWVNLEMRVEMQEGVHVKCPLFCPNLTRIQYVGKFSVSLKYVFLIQRAIILNEISKRKTNWIGHILCSNCLLRQVIEGNIKWGIEVTERRGRRRRKLLDDLKERRGYSHLNEEALDHAMWRARFGRGFGLVVRQTAKWMRQRDFSRWMQTFGHADRQNAKIFATLYWKCDTN